MKPQMGICNIVSFFVNQFISGKYNLFYILTNYHRWKIRILPPPPQKKLCQFDNETMIMGKQL